MREGTNRTIAVSGASFEALTYLLGLLYTGWQEGQEPTASLQLEALDLAHRWQLDHLVEALEVSLVRRVRSGLQKHTLCHADRMRLLDQLLEAAVLKHLCRLRTAC